MLKSHLPKDPSGHYIYMEIIGSGNFSTVYRAIHAICKHEVAIKVITKDKFPPEKFQRELSILQLVNHPFIVHFFEFFEDDFYYYLVMEYIQGENLFNLLNASGALPIWLCRHYFAELVSAIDYLHNELHIVHRDLKIDNIMIDQFNNIRLIDFGFGNIIRDKEGFLQSACGSLEFAPPEMFVKNQYTSCADMWSLGVCLYCLTLGRLPFEDKNIQLLIEKIISQDPFYPPTQNPDLTDLLRRLLMKEQSVRINITSVQQHPWFLLYPFAKKMNSKFGSASIWNSTDPKTFIPDPQIIREIRKLNIDPEPSINGYKQNTFDYSTAIYRILVVELLTSSMSEITDLIEKEEQRGKKLSQSGNDNFGYSAKAKRSMPSIQTQMLAATVVIRKKPVRNYNARLRHRSNPLSFS